MPHRPKSIGVDRCDRLFLTIAPKALRVLSNQPDSQHFGVRRAGPPCPTAFPDGSSPSQTLRAKAENQFMLPGFRFLLAAIVLSASLLIFGLGAAALLRAAHEEFASIPSRRPPPETLFAQRSDSGPVLAMLRVEPSAADEKAMEPAIADPVQAQPAIVSTPAESEQPATEPDQVAVLDTQAENSPPPEASTSEAAAPEIPIEAQPPSAQADDTASPAAANVAAITEIIAAAPDQSATTTSDRASAPTDDSARIAETRIATLGGPPVTVETRTPAKIAPAVVKKSSQARRVVKRRKIAQRARPAPPAPRQAANPFGS
jgi:hypothetical protein